MNLSVEQVESFLRGRGYRAKHKTTKKVGYQQAGSNLIYVNLNYKTGKSSLIAHPNSGVDSIRNRIPGLIVGAEYHHSSNMKGYPLRLHSGKNPIPYGWPLTFSSMEALKQTMAFLESGRMPVDSTASELPRQQNPQPGRWHQETRVRKGGFLQKLIALLKRMAMALGLMSDGRTQKR